LKHLTWILIASAAVVGVIWIESKKSTAQTTLLQSRISPGNTLLNNVGGILSAVGPDFEDLIGVTPQGSQSSYSGPYTAGGTVPINGGPIPQYTTPDNTLIMSGGLAIGGLDTISPYGSTIFDDGSGDDMESFV
jgi:hypothetical protein